MIYGLMHSGKPLTEEVRDVLLINACDMAQEGNERQQIKGRRYEGVISTNFEPVPFVGTTIVVFEADIVCPKIGPTKVRFGVRVTDLHDCALAKGKWLSLKEIMEDESISFSDKHNALLLTKTMGLLKKKKPKINPELN